MNDTRIIILFAGRFPSEKAAGLFVHLNALSLCSRASVEVVAPRRLGREAAADVPYEVSYVPVIDLSRVPVLARFANYLTVATFSVSALIHLVLHSKPTDIIISNDAFPLIVASVLRKNLMYEMHDFADRSLTMYRMLFRRVRWILATNEWKRTQLIARFGITPEKIILERNAVDTGTFGSTPRADARRALALPQREKIAVYTGHLYEWKGADTLAKAAQMSPDVGFYFVGGTEHDVARFRRTWEHVPNIHIVGHVPHDRIPLWQSAADVLVLPNSAKEEISVHYTSPMKLFEYMASERAIVASDIPSIREVLPEDAGFFAVPDDPASFSSIIAEALHDPGERPRRARSVAQEYSWEARAARILRHFV